MAVDKFLVYVKTQKGTLTPEVWEGAQGYFDPPCQVKHKLPDSQKDLPLKELVALYPPPAYQVQY